MKQIEQSINTATNNSFKIGDVHAEISGLENGAGFVLYALDGKLEMLEGYSYDEKYNINEIKTTYVDGKRDFEKVKLAWS